MLCCMGRFLIFGGAKKKGEMCIVTISYDSHIHTCHDDRGLDGKFGWAESSFLQADLLQADLV